MPPVPCANHPQKAATHTCQQCSKPVCALCVRVTNLGVFCSDACYEARREFREKLALNTTPRRRLGLDFGKMLRGLATLAALLAVLYGVFFFVYGDTTPEQIRARVMSWVRTATGP